MFTGLSAFSLTPFAAGQVSTAAFEHQIGRLADAGVDSIGALGSTGSYAYLRSAERQTAARIAVQAAGDTPVLVGVGAVGTRDVVDHIQHAQHIGAAGVLLAPVTYQPLTDDEVFGLFEFASRASELPIVVYDNPSTTKVTFSDALHARVAALPNVVSIKLSSIPAELEQARERVAQLRNIVPAGVTLGVSGDAKGAVGMLAGCDVWYSVLAGVLPERCLAIQRAAEAGQVEEAIALSDALEPVWSLFAQFGSYRAISAVAAELGVLKPESLHHPVQPLSGDSRAAVVEALEQIR